jgi:tight adherence protein C
MRHGGSELHWLASLAAIALVLLATWAQRMLAQFAQVARAPSFSADAPRWLVAVWRPAQWLALELGPRLSVARRERVLQRLQSADLDHVVGPEQWLASRCIAAALGGVAGALCAWAAGLAPIGAGAMLICLGWMASHRWLQKRRAAIEASVQRELPTYLDVLTLGVEAGVSLSTAMTLCVEKSTDTPLRRAFLRVLGEVRAGRTRAEALSGLEQRMRLPAITSLALALSNAERTGASVGQVLRVQADQRSAERFARAEKLAMEAPVKMLGPLILCIFPCTFLVLGFPIVMQLSGQFGQ